MLDPNTSTTSASPFSISSDAQLPDVITALQNLQQVFAAHDHDGVNSSLLTSLVLSALTVTKLDIPNQTSANSFHVDSSGNTWWGAQLLSNAVAWVLKDGSANFSDATVNGSSLAFEQDFGDGFDGPATISVDTTLTRDMFYTTLVVNSGINLNAAGFRIFCSISITNNGTIRNNGNNASGSTGGTAVAAGSLPGGVAGGSGGAGGGGSVSNPVLGGIAGTNGTNVTHANGVGGVAGGSGSGGTGGTGAGGTGGTVTLPLNSIHNAIMGYLWYDGATQHAISGGSGGAGGGAGGIGDGSSHAGGGGGAGGGSGATGGVVWISAKKIIISATGALQAIGGNGAAGTAAANGSSGGKTNGGQGGGGGSGGSGGVIFLKYSSYSNAGSVSAAGGTGATGGAGGLGMNGGINGGSGGSGNSGNAGIIVQISI